MRDDIPVNYSINLGMGWNGRLLFILLVSCWFSCSDNNRTKEKDIFTLNVKEAWFFQKADCESQFYIDTNSTAKQFKNYKASAREERKNGCIRTEIWLGQLKYPVSVAIPPQTVSLGGAVRNAKKKLIVYITESGKIGGFEGGVIPNDLSAINHLDSIVFNFLKDSYQIEQNENKAHVAFWPTGIVLKPLSDKISNVNKLFPFLLQGYIYFLREKSLHLYSKSLSDLSDDEQNLLSKLYPLYVDIV